MCETSQERGKSEVFLAKGVGSTSDMFPASCPQFQHATALVHQSKREHFRKSSLSMFIHNSLRISSSTSITYSNIRIILVYIVAELMPNPVS